MPSDASLAARRGLVSLAHRYHGAGWLLGTSGNLSARLPGPDGDFRVVVTASGKDKGALTVDDFVEIDARGAIVEAAPGERASAEASIHLAVYRTHPDVHVVLHVHTVSSTLARPDGPLPGALTFRDVEMIKGWGLWAEGAEAGLPVFANHAHVPTIASEIEAFYAAGPAEVPALLIAGHGITAWGATLFDANRHVEVTEFLCQLARAR